MDSLTVVMDALEQLGPRLEQMTILLGAIATGVAMWVSKVKKIQIAVIGILLFGMAVLVEHLFLGQITAAGSWDIGYAMITGAGVTSLLVSGTKTEKALTETDWRGRPR